MVMTTVGELITALQKFPETDVVMGYWDSCEWDVNGVWREKNAVFIDVSNWKPDVNNYVKLGD